jgi:hypothetical protein
VRPLSKAEAAKGSPWKLGPNSIALCNASGSTISGQSYTFGICSSPKIAILFALFFLCFSWKEWSGLSHGHLAVAASSKLDTPDIQVGSHCTAHQVVSGMVDYLLWRSPETSYSEIRM